MKRFAKLLLPAILLSLAFPMLRYVSQAAPRTAPGQSKIAKARQTAQPWTGSPLGPNDAFEAPDRAQVLRIETVMNDLRIVPGAKVADIGAGGGWFSMLAARRVGPQGVVYAEDILRKYTNFIAQRAKREGLTNVRTILGTVTDPKLPRNTLDAVLILNAYHEFELPLAVLRKIHLSLKAGARLGFIERDNEDLRREAQVTYAKTGQIKRRVDERTDHNPLTDDHRLAREIVEREAKSVGFRSVTNYDLGADHYVVIVEK
jgi:ubiquinone/menaquinone biosynthesis C-methylase UbiE